MVRRMDRQGEVLIWCRKCSGYARQRMGPKLMNRCKPEKVGPKEYGKMLNRIQVLEEGSISAREARECKIEGRRRRITRQEYRRWWDDFDIGHARARNVGDVMVFRSSCCRCRWTLDLSHMACTTRMWFPPVTSAFVVPWRISLDSGLLAILPVGALKSETSAVCAARPDNNAGFVNVGTHHLNTANVGSTSPDFSRHVATGSNRPCWAVHPDDSACPLTFRVHSLHIAKVRDTSTHLHVRVTSLDRCCHVAHSGNNVCLRILSRIVFALLQVFEGMSGSGQFNELFVNPSFMDWTPCWEARTLNFTVSALSDCVRPESLEEKSATFRIECFVVARSGKVRRTAAAMVTEKMHHQSFTCPNVSSGKPIKRAVNPAHVGVSLF